jgi:hypothetical protein
VHSNELTTISGNDGVRVVGDLVVVTPTCVLDLAAVEAMIITVDAKLQEHGLLRVLVDLRRVGSISEEADELFGAWSEGCVYHDRVAVLVRSELEGAASHAFCDPERAVEWLTNDSKSRWPVERRPAPRTRL